MSNGRTHVPSVFPRRQVKALAHGHGPAMEGAVGHALRRRPIPKTTPELVWCCGLAGDVEARLGEAAWFTMPVHWWGMVRVGCGRYDWLFQPQGQCLAQRLTITIDLMQSLPPTSLAVVTDWLSKLPYPWCSARNAASGTPALHELQPIREYLARVSGRGDR